MSELTPEEIWTAYTRASGFKRVHDTILLTKLVGTVQDDISVAFSRVKREYKLTVLADDEEIGAYLGKEYNGMSLEDEFDALYEHLLEKKDLAVSRVRAVLNPRNEWR